MILELLALLVFLDVLLNKEGVIASKNPTTTITVTVMMIIATVFLFKPFTPPYYDQSVMKIKKKYFEGKKIFDYLLLETFNAF